MPAPREGLPWHGPKAMAAYAIAGLVIAALSLDFGNKSRKNLVQAPVDTPTVEIQAPVPSSHSEEQEAVTTPRTAKVKSSEKAPRHVAARRRIW